MIIDIINTFYYQLRHIVLSKMIWIKNNSGKLQAMKKLESGLPTKSMHFRFRFQTNVIKTRYRLSINNVVEKSWSTMNFFNSLKPGEFYQKQHLAISNMIECTISIKCDLCFTYNLFPILGLGKSYSFFWNDVFLRPNFVLIPNLMSFLVYN